MGQEVTPRREQAQEVVGAYLLSPASSAGPELGAAEDIDAYPLTWPPPCLALSCAWLRGFSHTLPPSISMV